MHAHQIILYALFLIRDFWGDCKLHNDWMIYLHYVDHCIEFIFETGLSLITVWVEFLMSFLYFWCFSIVNFDNHFEFCSLKLQFFSLLSDQEREKEDITISSNGNKDSKMEGNDTTHHCVNYTLAPPEFVVPSSSKKGSATGLVVDWLNTFNFFDSKLNVDSF